MALTIPFQFFGTVAFALNKQRQPETKNNKPETLPAELREKDKT
jgi:hypothetical protein